MSWGYKIALAYGSFVIMILYFLFVASRQTNELMDEHYYEKELQFQNILNANDNLSNLNIRPMIYLENDQMRIQLPTQVSSLVTNGNIEFKRMADESQDISSNFTADEKGSFFIPIEKFHKGIYQLRIQWTSKGIPYMYNDQYNYSNQ